jgi:hypothetical protein
VSIVGTRPISPGSALEFHSRHAGNRSQRFQLIGVGPAREHTDSHQGRIRAKTQRTAVAKHVRDSIQGLIRHANRNPHPV